MDKVMLRGIGQGQWLSLKPPGRYRELEERQDADPDWYLQEKHCQKLFHNSQTAKWQLDTLRWWKRAWSGSSPPAATAATTSSNCSMSLNLVAEVLCVPPLPQVHSHPVYKRAVGITVQAEYLILKSMQALPYSVQPNHVWSTVSTNKSRFTLKGWQESPGTLALRWRNL